jgi:putative hydrolase of the HAD superfamily
VTAAVDAVLLDVGGVFCLPEHAGVLAVLARAGVRVDPDQLDRAHYLALAESEGAADGLPVAEAMARYRLAYLRATGVPADRLEAAGRELFDEPGFRVAWTRLRAGMVEELRALAGTGVALAIVSNAEGTVERQLRDLGVCQLGSGPGVAMAAIVDSDVVGVAKPDPRIFRIALAAAGARPERAAHVGDMLSTDVAGARAAGVRPLHYDPCGLCPGGGHEDVATLTELVPLLGLA